MVVYSDGNAASFVPRPRAAINKKVTEFSLRKQSPSRLAHKKLQDLNGIQASPPELKRFILAQTTEDFRFA
tara:strand:- start:393 stop:605 length:213 start_codon:yes stop_codon:yes gene_type:complete